MNNVIKLICFPKYMLKDPQITTSSLSVTYPSSSKKYLDSSGRHKGVLRGRCHHLLSLKNNRVSGRASKIIEKWLAWILEQVFFQFFPLNLCLSLHFSIPHALWDQSSVEDISANLGFAHSQVKQRIKLVCLSRAIRTSSLSFRNHMDHKLSI